MKIKMKSTGVLVYHFDHVCSDVLGSLHRVDGDSAGLFHVELLFETLLKLLLSEVQFGVVVVRPLKHIHKQTTVRKTDRQMTEKQRNDDCFPLYDIQGLNL